MRLVPPAGTCSYHVWIFPTCVFASLRAPHTNFIQAQRLHRSGKKQVPEFVEFVGDEFFGKPAGRVLGALRAKNGRGYSVLKNLLTPGWYRPILKRYPHFPPAL